MNSPIEQELLASLRTLDAAVKGLATGARPDLQAIFSQIDGLMRRLPKDVDPQLLHYLHKKSYEKARLYLEGRDAENQMGSCGHV